MLIGCERPTNSPCMLIAIAPLRPEDARAVVDAGAGPCPDPQAPAVNPRTTSGAGSVRSTAPASTSPRRSHTSSDPASWPIS